jgi:hypothetical protein
MTPDFVYGMLTGAAIVGLIVGWIAIDPTARTKEKDTDGE